MPFTRLGQVDYADPKAASPKDLEPLPWAADTSDALARYRDEQPPADALERVDNYAVVPREYFENPHLRVRALENELGFMFRNFISTLQDAVDAETGCKVAYAAGLAHGKRRYGKFLAGHQLDGGPKSMAMLQDYGHSSAGPRHATAMFAHYNNKLVEVARTEDSYGAHTGEESEVHRSFFDGFADGYMSVDPGLIRVEEMTRLRPDGKTEFVHRFWFARPE